MSQATGEARAGDMPATETARLLRMAKEPAPRPGGEVTVVGVVREVCPSSTGNVFHVNFEGVDRDGFFCAFFPATAGEMTAAFPGRADGPALAGRRVRVRGRLEVYRDRPEIVLRGPDQVTLLD